MRKKVEEVEESTDITTTAGNLEDLSDMGNPLIPVRPLSKLEREHAKKMTIPEVKWLVSEYYVHQDNRKRSENQLRELMEQIVKQRGIEEEFPRATKWSEVRKWVEAQGITDFPPTMEWLSEQSRSLEGGILYSLDKFSAHHALGQWMRSNIGIGPVVAAGLLSELTIRYPESDQLKQTVGPWWRFAGYDPTVKWEKGQKRPWNAHLKVICWHAGQSFMKCSRFERCTYGHIYRARKELEIARNDSGANAEMAATYLREHEYSKDTDAYAWLAGYYPHGVFAEVLRLPLAQRDPFLNKHRLEEPRPEFGRCPPKQIDARARRYAVKMFLSHVHLVWYWLETGHLPPLPYAITKLGHVDLVVPMDSDLPVGLARALKNWYHTAPPYVARDPSSYISKPRPETSAKIKATTRRRAA